MEVAAAYIMSGGLQSLPVRGGGASRSFAHTFSRPSTNGHYACHIRRSIRFSLVTPVSEWCCRHHSTACGAAGVVRKGFGASGSLTTCLHPVASFSCGGRREDDPPPSSCLDQIREQNFHTPSRLDSRIGGEHPSRNTDRQSASAAGRSNAFILVEQGRRSTMPMILTEDLRRRSSQFETKEADSARHKSSLSPGTMSDPVKQLCVAVDVDEVLGSFLVTLNEFIAEEYTLHHDVSEYYIYDFMKIWKCSQAEANNRVHAFFESEHFKNGIRPVPGAYQTLLQLAAYCNLVVVTSRQHVIRQHTLDWIERYYSGIFREVHFGNHFALEGQAKPKSEICRIEALPDITRGAISGDFGYASHTVSVPDQLRGLIEIERVVVCRRSLGAHILIDDNPRYAIECAECGIEVLLFDLHGSYPWSKTPCGPQHPLITRVKDWKEVERALHTRTCVEL